MLTMLDESSMVVSIETMESVMNKLNKLKIAVEVEYFDDCDTDFENDVILGIHECVRSSIKCNMNLKSISVVKEDVK